MKRTLKNTLIGFSSLLALTVSSCAMEEVQAEALETTRQGKTVTLKPDNIVFFKKVNYDATFHSVTDLRLDRTYHASRKLIECFPNLIYLDISDIYYRGLFGILPESLQHIIMEVETDLLIDEIGNIPSSVKKVTITSGISDTNTRTQEEATQAFFANLPHTFKEITGSFLSIDQKGIFNAGLMSWIVEEVSDGGCLERIDLTFVEEEIESFYALYECNTLPATLNQIRVPGHMMKYDWTSNPRWAFAKGMLALKEEYIGFFGEDIV